MKAKVDESICCGCGPCEDLCPEVFRILDGVAKVRVPVVPAAAEEKCRQAQESCPTEAITIEE